MRYALLAALPFMLVTMAQAEPLHGIAMHGEPALPKDYKSFSYVNPVVKKGGTINVVILFDSWWW